MTAPLFRPQVLSARGTHVVGTILLLRPIPIRLAAIVSGCLVIALAIYLGIGEYTQKVRVTGQITPAAGAIKIVAPQFGRVSARPVSDGVTVMAGQVLYELSAERSDAQGSIDNRIDASLSARRELLVQERALQAQQLQQHEKALRTRQQLLAAEITRLNEEIALQQNRIANSAQILTRYRALRTDGFVSEIQLVQQENDHNDQLARRQTLERSKLAATRDMMQAEEEADQIAGQLRLTAAQNDRTLASLAQEAAEHQGRSKIQVLASATGTVTALTAEPGQAVNAGMPLATILPAGSELEAQLLVPSRAIGFIAPGQDVLLRLSAFPYQKFGQIHGNVTRVEQSPIAEINAKDSDIRVSGTEPIYRIAVKLAQQSINAYGKEQAFLPGMTLEADIRQDRRRLVEWVLDPLLSVAKGRAE